MKSSRPTSASRSRPGIFQPSSPIHDGAAVVRGSRVAAAACLLPLSGAPAAPELGTRHRAAMGLSEEVDAAVVVVSEERGEVSGFHDDRAGGGAEIDAELARDDLR